MAPHAIVSYDDTQNDHDALTLGRTLRDAGARLTLAYVRHAVHRRPDDEELSQHEAEALLERGALLAGRASPSSAASCSAPPPARAWAGSPPQERADIVVFGSDYRTPQRPRVAIGRSAQTLLEGGPAALALAPGRLRRPPASRDIATIGVLRGIGRRGRDRDRLLHRRAARRPGGRRATAASTCWSSDRARRPAQGRVMITSRAANAIEEATSPVLIVARGVALTSRRWSPRSRFAAAPPPVGLTRLDIVRRRAHARHLGSAPRRPRPARRAAPRRRPATAAREPSPAPIASFCSATPSSSCTASRDARDGDGRARAARARAQALGPDGEVDRRPRQPRCAAHAGLGAGPGPWLRPPIPSPRRRPRRLSTWCRGWLRRAPA